MTEQNRPRKEVAQELGICINTLKKWLRDTGHSAAPSHLSSGSPSRVRELEAEVKALKKTLAVKEGTIAVVKKSVGIFLGP